MPKKKGSVSERGVKQDIIKCILLTNEPVKERDIRRYLEEKYKKDVDQGNINRHLHELCGELACIQLIPPVKKGLANHWNITKTEHLRNIMDKFNNIQLNKCEKALMIVLQKNGYDIKSQTGFKLYIKLLLSPSFFKACIGTNINILCKRSWGVFAYKHSVETTIIESQLLVCYDSYISRYPNSNMSYESFKSMLTQMSQKDINSIKKFMKIWEEELLGIYKEESDEIHRETIEEDLKIYEDMAYVTTDIMLIDSKFENEHFDLLFEHHLAQDIYDNVALKEDIMFALNLKAIEEEESGWKDGSEETMLYLDKLCESELQLISKIIAKYKQPSVYYTIYMDEKDIYKALKENFYPPDEESEDDFIEIGPGRIIHTRPTTSPYPKRFA